MGLALSPLFSHQTKTGTARHTQEDYAQVPYTIARHKAQSCRHEPDKQTRKSGYRGGLRGDGQTQVPPLYGQNGVDLSFSPCFACSHMGTLLSKPSFYYHLGHTKRGVTMTCCMRFFPASGYSGLQNKGKRKTTNRPCFTPPPVWGSW